MAVAITLSGCSGPGDTVGGDDAARLDVGPAEQLLQTVADRAPADEELPLPFCPVLDVADVERSAPAAVQLPPREQPWDGSLLGDLSTYAGEGVGHDPTVSCAGTWSRFTATAGETFGVILMLGRRGADPLENAEPFGGGQLDADCGEPTMCAVTWRSGTITIHISMYGTVPLAEAFDAWIAELVPAVVDGAAAFDVNTVLPPASTSPRPSTSPPPMASAPTGATTPPAPVQAVGDDCESQVIAAIADYARGAGTIAAVLAAAPAAVAADARGVAEEMRAWVATDPSAAALATQNPAQLFGSGAVIGSLCAAA